MIQLVTDPDGFYRRVKADVSLVGPLGVLLLWGLLRVGRELLVQVSAESTDLTSALGDFLSVFGLLVLWLVIGAVVYFVSGALGGTGGFRTTVGLVGYVFVAAVVGLVLEVVVAFLALASGGPVAENALYLVLSSSALDYAFGLWSLFFLGFAVKHAQNLEEREAVAAVALTIGVLFSLLFGFFALVRVLG